MEYSNDEIRRLIAERDSINRRIQSEIEKEKARYRINKKGLFFVLFILIFPIIAFMVNRAIFPKTSVWSWTYWIGE